MKVGDEVAVKIIKIDPEQRKIGLSLKDVPHEERENVLEAYRERKAATAASAPPPRAEPEAVTVDQPGEGALEASESAG